MTVAGRLQRTFTRGHVFTSSTKGGLTLYLKVQSNVTQSQSHRAKSATAFSQVYTITDDGTVKQQNTNRVKNQIKQQPPPDVWLLSRC